MRVWVTRDESIDGPLSTALRDAGLTVVLEPVLERRTLTDAADTIGQLDVSDWLVLTSVYAVRAIAVEPARRPRVAVVGEASRQAAAERGFRVELVAAAGTGEGLFKELRQVARSGRICYPRSSLAKVPPAWPDVELISPVLYETVERRFDPSVVDRVDVVCVASPSAVAAVGPVDLPFASIGPTTSHAIRSVGKVPWVEAPESSFRSLSIAIYKRAIIERA
ncbi:MAG: uroporphyrinogen-III synthase [Phycisphaerae bacterium]